ncbi:putative MFS-type transporter YdeG [Flavimobilis marinus]|uniref:Predicted arabinose efflux permease, MFS family n=1 Tax=Flavimobilis marinus TaxID=285351 RepID=A0A1I2DEF1_9MICO|nr:MFS transporter [Flavimobilis marinus]GHG45446.1 putative MFS-type transporter YdeG [Flavimobilis marinus]SFE78533.1 Predicted arabinose efflux permease, MFS family [Flavimobilis marinus]
MARTDEPGTTPSSPVPSDAQRRTLRVLVAAQVLSGAGLAAGITVGALLAQEMLGATSLAGLPTALFTAGSAAAAVLVGRVSQRAGRRAGLALGYGIGAVGSVAVVVAAVLDSVPLLFAALVVYGAGTATNLQARYAGADLAAPAHRGRAVSTVLVATTLGAVAGPNLVTVMGRLAESWGIPALAGPFLLAALAYGSAGAVLWVLLRPDPLLLARELAVTAAAEAAAGRGPAVTDVESRPRTVLHAGMVMVLTQLVMAAIMTMTPVHMRAHGHSLGAAGLVIAVHVGAMYLPAPVSGWLVDRFGPRAVSGGAGVTLLAAGLVAALAPVESVGVLALALALLGFGWSLGLVAGTAMLADAVPLAARARTQGSVDLTIALAGASGGMASGFVVASTSYAVLSLVGGILALAIVPLVALSAREAVRR